MPIEVLLLRMFTLLRTALEVIRDRITMGGGGAWKDSQRPPATALLWQLWTHRGLPAATPCSMGGGRYLQTCLPPCHTGRLSKPRGLLAATPHSEDKGSHPEALQPPCLPAVEATTVYKYVVVRWEKREEEQPEHYEESWNWRQEGREG